MGYPAVPDHGAVQRCRRLAQQCAECGRASIAIAARSSLAPDTKSTPDLQHRAQFQRATLAEVGLDLYP